MALVKCPDCGGEVSDKAKQCIHCGCPIGAILCANVNTVCRINDREYDFSDALVLAVSDDIVENAGAIGNIRRKTSLTLTDGADLVDIIKERKSVPETFTPRYPLEDREKLYGSQKSISVSCPYCQSTNTRKISGLSKAGSVAVWGFLATSKVSKQWHCNSCGSDF